MFSIVQSLTLKMEIEKSKLLTNGNDCFRGIGSPSLGALL